MSWFLPPCCAASRLRLSSTTASRYGTPSGPAGGTAAAVGSLLAQPWEGDAWRGGDAAGWLHAPARQAKGLAATPHACARCCKRPTPQQTVSWQQPGPAVIPCESLGTAEGGRGGREPPRVDGARWRRQGGRMLQPTGSRWWGLGAGRPPARSPKRRLNRWMDSSRCRLWAASSRSLRYRPAAASGVYMPTCSAAAGAGC